MPAHAAYFGLDAVAAAPTLGKPPGVTGHPSGDAEGTRPLEEPGRAPKEGERVSPPLSEAASAEVTYLSRSTARGDGERERERVRQGDARVAHGVDA